jgi:hypothetical protein
MEEDRTCVGAPQVNLLHADGPWEYGLLGASMEDACLTPGTPMPLNRSSPAPWEAENVSPATAWQGGGEKLLRAVAGERASRGSTARLFFCEYDPLHQLAHCIICEASLARHRDASRSTPTEESMTPCSLANASGKDFPWVL